MFPLLHKSISHLRCGSIHSQCNNDKSCNASSTSNKSMHKMAQRNLRVLPVASCYTHHWQTARKKTFGVATSQPSEAHDGITCV